MIRAVPRVINELLPELLIQLTAHLRQYPFVSGGNSGAVPAHMPAEALKATLQQLPPGQPLAAALADACAAARAAGFPEGPARVFSQALRLLPQRTLWPQVCVCCHQPMYPIITSICSAHAPFHTLR